DPRGARAGDRRRDRRNRRRRGKARRRYRGRRGLRVLAQRDGRRHARPSHDARPHLADTRARDAAAALRRELDPVATHARTGCTIHASYLPAKLRYLRDAAPDAFGRTAKWLSLGEYLYFRLFGGTRAAHGMASATGLYDQRT